MARMYPLDEFPIVVERGKPVMIEIDEGALAAIRREEMMRTNQKTTKKTKPKLNKFYCAHPRISDAMGNGYNDEWTNATLAEATKKAEKILNESPQKTCVAIVKVVRIVRRSTPPISVEDID